MEAEQKLEPLAGKILGVSEKVSYFWEGLRVNISPLFLLDILIVSILFYWVFVFLKETRAMRILYGFFFLVALLALGSLLDLALLNWILKNLMTMLVVAIPIVFQPELRTVLEKVGRSGFLPDKMFSRSSDVIEEVVTAARKFSEQKVGALVVFQRQTGLREYIENGVLIDAKVKSVVLLSIFFPRSPLHDGAVIISGDRVISARSTLPVSESLTNPDLGMRHKSAAGITEISDAIAIVVSEETGTVSLAVGGKLERRISDDRLRSRLSSLLRGKG